MNAIAPPPVPADVGLVAALSIEVAPLLDRLTNVRKYTTARRTVIEGELAGKIVAAIITGPGRNAATKGANHLLIGHRPKWVVSAGFAGALNPSLRRDDIVLANEIIDPEGARYVIDLAMQDDPTARVGSGKLATVDAIVRTAEEKSRLRELTGADVVDMETSAVAAVCRERGFLLLSVRVISDEAGIDLPPEIAAILGRSGGYRVGAALGAIWRRPSSLKDLFALREHAVAAAERLSQVVPGILGRLP